MTVQNGDEGAELLAELSVSSIARGRQGDLLNGSSHGGSLRGGRPRDSFSTSNPPRKPAQPSSSLIHRARSHLRGGSPTLPAQARTKEGDAQGPLFKGRYVAKIA